MDTQEEWEKGRVKFFDTRVDKQYGFIEMEKGGKDIWFHINDGLKFECHEGGARFSLMPLQRHPKKGEEVLFICATGSENRPKAAPWGYAEEYDSYSKIVTESGAYNNRAFANYPWLEGMFHFTGYSLSVQDDVHGRSYGIHRTGVRNLEILPLSVTVDAMYAKIKELISNNQALECAVLNRDGIRIELFSFDGAVCCIERSERQTEAKYLVFSRYANHDTVTVYDITLN